MKSGRLKVSSLFAGIMLSLGAVPAVSSAQTLTTLANFDASHGWLPESKLIFGPNGDLIGTAQYGGTTDYGGTVFQVNKTADGYSDMPSVLVSFEGATGTEPYGGVVADKEGNLFGTTTFGGTLDEGTVFEVVKTAYGYSTTPKILFNFDGTHGLWPTQNLIIDAAGNLFGTTYYGGAQNNGIVFEIAKTARGYADTPVLLADFEGLNGANPYSALVADRSGNLFGTTQNGGGLAEGTVFEIVKTNKGYSEGAKVLFSFDDTHGLAPQAGLIIDGKGNLFGTTFAGGAFGEGTVFELAKTDEGYASTPTILTSFDGDHGALPYSALIEDAHGNLFGTTIAGGTGPEYGTVFKLEKTAEGYASTPTVMANFDGTNGATPVAALLADSQGNLFGTTLRGGSLDNGTVYEITGSGFVLFGGTPGTSNCVAVSTSDLAHTYGDMGSAASALGYSSVDGLQRAVEAWCGR